MYLYGSLHETKLKLSFISMYSHSSSRALSQLRDTNSNFVVSAYPVMGDLIGGQGIRIGM